MSPPPSSQVPLPETSSVPPAEPPNIAARVARGASASLARTLVVYVAAGGAMLVIGRRLPPREYGVYSVLTSLSLIVYNLVTAGFAYSFTRAEAVDSDAVQAAFWTFETLYLVLAAGLVGASFLVSGTEAHVLLRGMAAFLVLAPFRFPALVECWREVQLTRLAMIDASEQVAFQLVAVTLVLTGLRESAFAYALAAAATVSATLSMLLVRWRPGRPVYAPLIPWWSRARPYFASTMLTVWRDVGHTPLVALVLGGVAAGYFGWAAGVALALSALLTVLTNAAFVGFARVRDVERTTDALSRVLRLMSLALGASLAVLAGAAAPIAAVVFAPKWLPAVPCMRFLTAAVGVNSLLGVFFNLALADGRVRIANTWLFGVLLATITLALGASTVWGVTAYAVGYCTITTAVLATAWRQTARMYPVPAATVHYVLQALLSAVVAAAAGALIAGTMGNTIASLGASLAASFSIYCLAFVAVARGAPLADVRQLLQVIRPA